MDASKRLTASKGLDVRDGRAGDKGGRQDLAGALCAQGRLSPGLCVAVDELGGLAADPADERGDLGAGAHRLGRSVLGGQLLRGEHAVDLAVADDVDGLGVAAAPGPGQPVMAVGAGTADDGPAADGIATVSSSDH